MPHGSWFSFLPFHDRFVHYAAEHFGQDGGTWIEHGPVGVEHVYGGLFVLSLIALFAVVTDTSLYNAKSVVPENKLTIRTFMELMVETIFTMMSDVMGKKAARYFMPLIGTCAVFILFSNAIGLVPFFLPPTDSLNTTLALGLVIFIATHIYGLKENGTAHVAHLFGPWLGPLGLPLNILLFLIETVSHLVRPCSLAIRLMANMMADHMVLTIFLGLVPFVVPLPMYVLGTIVVIVQALVFSLLSTVYIGMAIEHADH
ncbi:MAG: F0F1 ATP synthase subunit A [Myxococcales bacterium]|nr:F0F1 ATP synthase subunit A [Myxococcales bacterium]